MVTLLEVKDIKFATEDKRYLSANIRVEGSPLISEDEFVPYTTAAFDDSPLGQALYARIMDSEFGEIQAYTPPTPTLAQIIDEEERWIKEQEQGLLPIIEDEYREQMLPIALRRSTTTCSAGMSYQEVCEKYAQLRDYKESGQLHPSNRPF